jgi:hypothetical protein
MPKENNPQGQLENSDLVTVSTESAGTNFLK